MAKTEREKVLEKRVLDLEDAYQALHQKIEALQNRELSAYHLIEQANGIIYRTDIDGRFSYLNPFALEISGYSREELYGKPCSMVVHPDFRNRVKRFYGLQFIKKLTITYLEFPIIKKNGDQIWTGQQVQLLSEGGQTKGFMAIARDITERKKTLLALKESEEKYRNILKNIEDGYYEVDIAGNLTFMNDGLCAILGYSRNELIGMNNRKYMIPENAKKAFQAFNRVYKTGKPAKGIANIVTRKGGSIRYVEASVSLVRDSLGQRIGFRGILRDITQRKEAEKEIKKYQEDLENLVEDRTAELMREVAERKRIEEKTKKLNIELEKRVKQRTAELEKAYKELKKLDQMKDSFLSLVSHELRTPLTSIRSFSEILIKYQDEDIATRREFLDIINSESERLTRLINDILDLSKIEAGGMVWHDKLISIESIINTVVRTQHQLIKQKELTVSVDIQPNLPFVNADQDRIQQVITNLLSNAISFSHQKQQINIYAELIEGKRAGERSGYVRVSISDQGIGIDEKDYQIIFNKFGQVSTDELTNKPKGTGLGLPICKEIIFHYQGNIWVEANKAKGSTFFFTLPAVKFSSLPPPKDRSKNTAI